MAVTQNTYTGDGTTVLFSFTFPYLETTDIKVSLNGTVTTAYTLANATTVQFNTAPVNGAAIRIYRETDDSALAATFYPGSAIRSNDLNDNFTQNLYVTQESTNNAATATSTANTALTNSNTAISTANSAVSTANTASSNASAAVSTANTASSNASAAVSTANTASSNATTAVNTANAATATANSAASDAATAISTANSAVSTANTASTTATNAVNTANSASSAASSAVSTANTASSNASAAVSTANTASSNATSAVNTANSALSTANAAASAVADAILYDIVANVAAIPASPANNDAVEVTDSTGIESFTPLTGIPGGFAGNSGLSVRIVYTTTGNTWTWIQYFPNDPENRYLKEAGDTMTGALGVTTGTAAAPSVFISGDTNTGIYSPGADQVAVATNGVGRLFVDASGRLLAGTSTPGATNADDLNINAPGDCGITIRAGNTSSSSIFFADGTTGNENYRGYFEYDHDGDYLRSATAGSERLRITSAGLVGIGTSTPAVNLHVASFANTNLRISSSFSNSPETCLQIDTVGDSSIPKVYFSKAGTIRGGVYYNHSATGSAERLGFHVAGGSDKLSILGSGNVGIGTTSPGQLLHLQGSTPALQFEPAADSQNSLIIFRNAADSTTKGLIYYNHSNDSLNFTTNGTTTDAVIDSSGRLLVGTSSNQGGYLLQVKDGDISTTKLTGAAGGNAVQMLRFRVHNTSNTSQSASLAGISAETVSAWGGVLTFHTKPTNHSPDESVTERMRIDSSGRVGIGTTSPSTLLHLSASTSPTITFTDQTTANTTGRVAFLNGTVVIDSQFNNGKGIIRFSGNNGGTEYGRFDTSGRLLVGTSSARSTRVGATSTTPSFQVEGSTLDTSSISLSRTSNAGPRLFLNRPEASLAVDASIGDILFNVQNGNGLLTNAASISAAVDATIDATDGPGRLVFSTTADGASSPTERMRISSTGAVIINGQSVPNAEGFYVDNSISAFNRTSDGAVVRFYRSATTVGSIQVTTTATSYNTSSDYRLKENVIPVSDGITRLQQLKPSRFNFIADPDKTVDGFLAHEVQDIVPEAITGEKDAVDDEGNPEYQGIDQSKLVPLLTAALQEAIGEIESLKARLTAAGI